MIVPYSRFVERRVQRYLLAAADASREDAPVIDVLSAVVVEPVPGVAPPARGRVTRQNSSEKRFK